MDLSEDVTFLQMHQRSIWRFYTHFWVELVHEPLKTVFLSLHSYSFLRRIYSLLVFKASCFGSSYLCVGAKGWCAWFGIYIAYFSGKIFLPLRSFLTMECYKWNVLFLHWVCLYFSCPSWCCFFVVKSVFIQFPGPLLK